MYRYTTLHELIYSFTTDILLYDDRTYILTNKYSRKKLISQDFNVVTFVAGESATSATTTAAVVWSRGIGKSTSATWIPATIVQRAGRP